MKMIRNNSMKTENEPDRMKTWMKKKNEWTAKPEKVQIFSFSSGMNELDKKVSWFYFYPFFHKNLGPLEF